MDVIEVQCIVANLIFEVSNLSDIGLVTFVELVAMVTKPREVQ